MQAQFSDDGTWITILFSSGGSPSSMLLDPGNATSGAGPGSCVSILDAATVEILGDGATCEYSASSRTHSTAKSNPKLMPALRTFCRLQVKLMQGVLVLSGEWTGDRELDVSLGYGTLAVPATSSVTGCGNYSSVALLDGGVRTEAFAVLSSSGCTPILSPDNPAAVSVVLVAPEVRLWSAFDGKIRRHFNITPDGHKCNKTVVFESS